jgi:hypothetical protein
MNSAVAVGTAGDSKPTLANRTITAGPKPTTATTAATDRSKPTTTATDGKSTASTNDGRPSKKRGSSSSNSSSSSSSSHRSSSSSRRSLIKRQKTASSNDWLAPAEAVAVMIQPVYDPADWSAEKTAVAARSLMSEQMPHCYRSLAEPPSFAVFADVPALVKNALYWLETLLIARFHRTSSTTYERAMAFFDIDDTILVNDELIHPDVYVLYDYCKRMNVEIVFLTARQETAKIRSETAATLKALGLPYDRLILMPTDVLPHLVVPEPTSSEKETEDGKIYVGSDIPAFVVDSNSKPVRVDRSKPIRLAPVRYFVGPGGQALTDAIGAFKGRARAAFAGRVLLNVGNSITDLFTAPTRDIDAIRAGCFGDRSCWMASGSAADGAALAVKLPNQADVRWITAAAAAAAVRNLPVLPPLSAVLPNNGNESAALAVTAITKKIDAAVINNNCAVMAMAGAMVSAVVAQG